MANSKQIKSSSNKVNQTRPKKQVIDKQKLKVRIPLLKCYKKLRSNYCANFSQVRYFTILDKRLAELHKVSEEKEKEQIKEAEIVVKEHKSKKKKIWSLVFFLFNVIFIAIFILIQGKNGLVAPPEELHANWWFLIVAFSFVILWVIIDTIRFQVLIHKATGFNRPILAYKISALGKYYDVVTPFSTGGQPFQIFYANKYGIKGGQSVSITMSKYMFQQIAYFILVTVVLFTNLGVSGNATGAGQTVISIMSWIGYIIVTVLVLGISLIMLNKKIGVGIVVFFLKLFCKIFKKDYNVLFRKVMRTVTLWQLSMRKYKKSPFIWIFNILTSIGFFLVQYSIPFFIYCAFEGFHPEVWFQVVTITIMVDLAASFNPLPAGAGVSELSFDALFRGLFQGSTLWAMLIWRLLTMYIFLFQGLGVIIYDYTIGNRRWARNKEKWLERCEKSKAYKRIQQEQLLQQQNMELLAKKQSLNDKNQ